MRRNKNYFSGPDMGIRGQTRLGPRAARIVASGLRLKARDRISCVCRFRCLWLISAGKSQIFDNLINGFGSVSGTAQSVTRPVYPPLRRLHEAVDVEGVALSPVKLTERGEPMMEQLFQRLSGWCVGSQLSHLTGGTGKIREHSGDVQRGTTVISNVVMRRTLPGHTTIAVQKSRVPKRVVRLAASEVASSPRARECCSPRQPHQTIAFP